MQENKTAYLCQACSYQLKKVDDKGFVKRSEGVSEWREAMCTEDLWEMQLKE